MPISDSSHYNPFRGGRLQREALLAALRRWEAREEPGHIWVLDFLDYAPDPAIHNNGEIIRE